MVQVATKPSGPLVQVTTKPITIVDKIQIGADFIEKYLSIKINKKEHHSIIGFALISKFPYLKGCKILVNIAKKYPDKFLLKDGYIYLINNQCISSSNCYIESKDSDSKE